MSEFNQIQTLQYMGSKSRLLDSICTPIINDSSIDTVIDLFAGTGSVGYALKEYKHIISNDLEEYAYTINSSILNGCSFSKEDQEEFLQRVDFYNKASSELLKEALNQEKMLLCGSYDSFKEYAEFVENTPSVFGSKTSKSYYAELKKLVDLVIPGQTDQAVPFPCLFLTYYANAYFGLNQCCQIDAVCAAIAEMSDKRQKNFILTALMSVMSSTASTTTHFAQFLKVKSASTYKNLAQKRSSNIVKNMIEVIESYRIAGIADSAMCKHECYNNDFSDCLARVELNESVLVYADPPYFKEHYSRYYHVLNTVCLYDYPNLAINPQRKVYSVGRYRENRNVSDFGKKAAALGAFERLLKLCSSHNARLMISYSDNSIVPIEALGERRISKVDNIFHRQMALNFPQHGKAANS